MEPKRLRRWALAMTKKGGIEELVMFHPWIGDTEITMKPVLRAAEELNPELRGKLRIVAVVLDIREMTKREEADFRKFQAKD